MTPEQQAAYVNAQAAAALIEALGMVAENKLREQRGETLAYDGAAFDDVIRRYRIDHSSVVGGFR